MLFYAKVYNISCVFLFMKGLVIFVLIFLLFAGLLFFYLAQLKGSFRNSDDIAEGNGVGLSDDSGLGEDLGIAGDDSGNAVGGGRGGSGGAGGGGSGVGSAGGSAGNGCQTVQVSYALKNFAEEEVCNSFQDGICVDKTISCNVEVHNFDYTLAGNFVIEIDFLEQESRAIFDSSVKSGVIQPRSFEIFEAVIQVPQDLADKDIGCSFKTQSVPSKEVC